MKKTREKKNSQNNQIRHFDFIKHLFCCFQNTYMHFILNVFIKKIFKEKQFNFSLLQFLSRADDQKLPNGTHSLSSFSISQ